MTPFSSCIVTLVFGLKLEFDKSIDNPPDPINGNEKVRNDLPTMIKFVMMRVIGAENHAILRNQKQINLCLRNSDAKFSGLTNAHQ